MKCPACGHKTSWHDNEGCHYGVSRGPNCKCALIKQEALHAWRYRRELLETIAAEQVLEQAVAAGYMERVS